LSADRSPDGNVKPPQLTGTFCPSRRATAEAPMAGYKMTGATRRLKCTAGIAAQKQSEKLFKN